MQSHLLQLSVFGLAKMEGSTHGRKLEIHRHGELVEIWPFCFEVIQNPYVCLLILAICYAVHEWNRMCFIKQCMYSKLLLMYRRRIKSAVAEPMSICSKKVEVIICCQDRWSFLLHAHKLFSSSCLPIHQAVPICGLVFSANHSVLWSFRGKAAATESGTSSIKLLMTIQQFSGRVATLLWPQALRSQRRAIELFLSRSRHQDGFASSFSSPLWLKNPVYNDKWWRRTSVFSTNTLPMLASLVFF